MESTGYHLEFPKADVFGPLLSQQSAVPFLNLTNVPGLAELSIRSEYLSNIVSSLSRILSVHSQLNCLTIGPINLHEDLTQLATCHFTRLVRLEVDVRVRYGELLTEFVSVLSSFPSLKELIFRVFFPSLKELIFRVPAYSWHDPESDVFFERVDSILKNDENLKSFEFHVYTGVARDVDFIRHVAAYACGLEKILIACTEDTRMLAVGQFEALRNNDVIPARVDVNIDEVDLQCHR